MRGDDKKNRKNGQPQNWLSLSFNAQKGKNKSGSCNPNRKTCQKVEYKEMFLGF